MLPIELQLRDLPDLYARFSNLVGAGAWTRVSKERRQSIKGNRFLSDYYASECAIPFQLTTLGRLVEEYGRFLPDGDSLRPLYPACAFMGQALHLLETWPREDAGRLRRRIHGALDKSEDMRGLRLEFAAATHFTSRGWRVDWPELLGVQGETFDLLVTPPVGSALEVECKSIGRDKGRRISRPEVLEFLHLLRPYLKAVETGLITGLSVSITVPVRLPSAHKARTALAAAVGRAVLAGVGTTLQDGTSIRIDSFDGQRLGPLPMEKSPRELREAVDGITATRNREAMLIGTSAGGALELVLQSAKDDVIMKATMDTLSDASKRQLAAHRGGLLIASLDGLTGDALAQIASEDGRGQQAPSLLQLAVSRFLSSEERGHVIGGGILESFGAAAEG